MRAREQAHWWHALNDGRVQCDLCPRECRLRDGQRGYCFMRANVEGRLSLTTDGRSSGFCLDPIEKKPLAHFLPGTAALSFGTAGCNLGCKFCQNHEISTSRERDALMVEARPVDIARAGLAARAFGCRSVAFTYNDPVVFAEYAIDVAAACHEAGLKTVAVTAGYLNPEPRAEFFASMDAANVDLKGFSEQFYHALTGAHLSVVQDTLRYLVHETNVWTEITTLLIPGHNDDDAELHSLAAWIRDELSPQVPLHLSAFHPDYRMRDVAPTPAATLRRARTIAREEGLAHVYTGNVHDVDGDTTCCAACGEVLIVRDWFRLLEYRLRADGACPGCGIRLAGRFAESPGNFGAHRIPLGVGRELINR